MSIKSSSSFTRMRRYPDRGWIAGVCAGLADYLDWNVKLVRVIFVIAFICSGFFPVGLVYCVLWYLLDSEDSPAPGSSYSAPPRHDSAPPRSSAAGDVRTRFARLEDRLRGLEECVTSKDFELRREFRKLES